MRWRNVLQASGVVVVTGGTGVIGERVIEILLRSGASVRVLSRKPEAGAKRGPGVEHHVGDIQDPASLASALGGAEFVIHMAGARTGDASALWRTNVTGTELLLRQAKRAQIRGFLHISSAAVYGDGAGEPFAEDAKLAPVDPYGCSKLEGERAVARELANGDVAWAVLRPFGVYGPSRLEFFQDVARRRVWLYGLNRALVHPTYVDDVAEGVMLTLERLSQASVCGQTFNIAGDRALEHFEYVKCIAARLGVSVRRIGIPAWLENSVSDWVPASLPFSARLSPRVVSRTAHTEKATQLLGWRPVPLERGIDQTVSAGLRNGSLPRAKAAKVEAP